MPETFSELKPSPRLLLGPGPSETHPRVLRAMATPVLGHLDAEFLQIMNETMALLREVFQTKNEVTLPISGTGMAGMETAIVNVLEPGDSLLVAAKGYFGEKMIDVATRAGAKVTALRTDWGKVFPVEELGKAIREQKPKVFGIVHAETSTGAWQPLEGLADACRAAGSLLLVDTVTSLATVPVKLDEWGIDVAYSGSQKGLGCPPGTAPVSFSGRAMEVVRSRKKPVQSFYFDIVELMKYWGSDRMYHHTAPISSIYALREGLRVVLEEGLTNRFARHQQNWQALKAGAESLGLKYLTQPGHQLPALSALLIPDGVEDLPIRKRLATEFGIEIGGGLGAYKGKLWRVGLMGHGSRLQNVWAVLGALRVCLIKEL